jgi:hypothetical protein
MKLRKANVGKGSVGVAPTRIVDRHHWYISSVETDIPIPTSGIGGTFLLGTKEAASKVLVDGVGLLNEDIEAIAAGVYALAAQFLFAYPCSGCGSKCERL